METVRRAVIDVGTNSIKLLVAEVKGQEVGPVCEESKQTRLGKGFYESCRLQPEAIRKTAEAVAKFAATARAHQASEVRIIATSAARDAVNAAELTQAISAASGLGVEIISGEQEANWVFQGVSSDHRLAGQPLLLLDAGGGSTEFIVGQGQEKIFAHSFALGTVRLLERFPQSDPPTAQELSASRQWLSEFMTAEVGPKLAPALLLARGPSLEKNVRLVGAGGTTTILARMEAGLEEYDREKIESVRLGFERIEAWADKLWRLPLEERKKIAGLPKNRADVILPGALIYESVMRHFHFQELRVSTRGLRFAVVMTR